MDAAGQPFTLHLSLMSRFSFSQNAPERSLPTPHVLQRFVFQRSKCWSFEAEILQFKQNDDKLCDEKIDLKSLKRVSAASDALV